MFVSDLWLIYLLVFAAVLLGIQGLYWGVYRARKERKQINRRVELSSRLQSQIEVLETLRRERSFAFLDAIPAFRKAGTLLTQTGLKLDRGRVLFWYAVPAVLLTIVFSLGLGFGLLALIGALLIAFAGLWLVLSIIRRRRIARFSEQLPDTLDVIVRGLRAGHPFRVAVGLAAREMPDPTGTEFGILLDEVTFGLDLSTAIDNLYRRVGQEDLAFFGVAVSIQNQTGGNLAEILGRLSRLLRSRSKMQLKIRALTAEGRLSAIFLSLAPFILFLIINLISPDYFWEVRSHPAIVPVVILAALLLIGGNFILYRMVHFKA